MPHSRPRHILPRILERLKFSRVVSLQGPRQSGKSFLAREILPIHLKKSGYLTLDEARLRSQAQKNPDTFLARHEGRFPLIIDEAQKAPDLFDAIKLKVDQDATPGQFVLLGSTEFSREALVRESLTGRLSRVRIYPFTLREALELSAPTLSEVSWTRHKSTRPSRAAVLRHLERGGLPGIFAIREAARRYELLDDWISLTCERDIFQFPGQNPDPALAREILEWIARGDAPDTAGLIRKLRVNPRKLAKHLNLLSQLFALVKLEPSRLGTGKTRYFACDPGLSTHLGASLQRQLTTWLIHEQQAQWQCLKGPQPKFKYFRGVRGGIVDLVVETGATSVIAIKMIESERFDSRDLEILRSFQKRAVDGGYKKIRLIALAPVSTAENEGDIEVMPWEWGA